MTTTGEFAAERAQLGLRDRDELHEIASANGHGPPENTPETTKEASARRTHD